MATAMATPCKRRLSSLKGSQPYCHIRSTKPPPGVLTAEVHALHITFGHGLLRCTS
jgi:hypothetical protein